MSAAPAQLVDRLRNVCESFLDPESGRPLGVMGQVRETNLSGTTFSAVIGLTTYSAPLWDECRQCLEQALGAALGASPEIADASPPYRACVEIVEHRRRPEPIGQIGLTAKSVIAVGSGKGGVGKSTVAASLACGLQQAGSSVGLLDADVYGPSIPHLLGVSGQPTVVDKKLQPVMANGMPVMSMGFLTPPGEAVVWRGPMLHGAITQFLRDTAWGDLDYLIIDMPPGTGDIALTLSQLLPLTGAVVVCTPQDVALLDAVKAIAMFRKVHIPLLGVVENMSYFLCPDNGMRYDIFGSGGARAKSLELDVPFLGEVPIQIPIRERGDAGRTAENPRDAESGDYFRQIVMRLVRQIADSRAVAPPLPSLAILG